MDDVTAPGRTIHRGARDDCQWEGVERRPYKEDERALFRSVTRQVLFSDPQLAGEWRYFEVAPGGFTSLERHAHMHAVMIFRGRGHCLVGREVRAVVSHDLITVPPWTWHQFRATPDELLGFLCLVDANRDRPQLPTAQELAELNADPEIAAFLAT
jgi:quercetin dioxygenase-like cupin family protein